MGAEENAAIIRRGYEAFNSADMATLTELFDENAVWHTPGQSSLGGDFQGRDAVFGQFGRFGEGTAGTFKADLHHVVADDDGHVVGIHTVTAERDGKQLSVECCLLFEMKDGKVVEGREHFYDLAAWDEFWS